MKNKNGTPSVQQTGDCHTTIYAWCCGSQIHTQRQRDEWKEDEFPTRAMELDSSRILLRAASRIPYSDIVMMLENKILST